jgi:brefeldin A-inhibited guanine nucleotide-exchange protein
VMGENVIAISSFETVLTVISDEENIATMHAFVNMLDFKDLLFVDALRTFLQPFRLPGEAQKIDRFVLKFAERYIAGNPKTPFANAGLCTIILRRG